MHISKCNIKLLQTDSLKEQVLPIILDRNSPWINVIVTWQKYNILPVWNKILCATKPNENAPFGQVGSFFCNCLPFPVSLDLRRCYWLSGHLLALCSVCFSFLGATNGAVKSARAPISIPITLSRCPVLSWLSKGANRTIPKCELVHEMTVTTRVYCTSSVKLLEAMKVGMEIAFPTNYFPTQYLISSLEIIIYYRLLRCNWDSHDFTISYLT